MFRVQAGRKPIPTRRVLEAVLWILNKGRTILGQHTRGEPL